MPKPINCCVPGYTNNFRTVLHSSIIEFHRETRIRRQYKILIRNATLKLNSDNIDICANHFNNWLFCGQKLCQIDLFWCLPVEDVIKVQTKSGLKPSAGLSFTDDIAGNSLDRNESLGSELSLTDDKLHCSDKWARYRNIFEWVQEKVEVTCTCTCNFKSMQRWSLAQTELINSLLPKSAL